MFFMRELKFSKISDKELNLDIKGQEGEACWDRCTGWVNRGAGQGGCKEEKSPSGAVLFVF
jgi:hypothetical protein